MQTVAAAPTEYQGSQADEETAIGVRCAFQATLWCAFLVPYHREGSHGKIEQGSQEDHAQDGYVLSHSVIRSICGSTSIPPLVVLARERSDVYGGLD